MSRTLACLALLLVLAAPAFAEGEDPETDWCSIRHDACQAFCSRYNFTAWGVSFPSPRTMICSIECGIAYAGCGMLRFHSGT